MSTAWHRLIWFCDYQTPPNCGQITDHVFSSSPTAFSMAHGAAKRIGTVAAYLENNGGLTADWC